MVITEPITQYCAYRLPCGLCRYMNSPCPYQENKTVTATTTATGGDYTITFATQTTTNIPSGSEIKG